MILINFFSLQVNKILPDHRSEYQISGWHTVTRVNRKLFLKDVSSRPRVLLYDITKALVLEEQARSLIVIHMSSSSARDHRLDIIVEDRDKFVSLS